MPPPGRAPVHPHINTHAHTHAHIYMLARAHILKRRGVPFMLTCVRELDVDNAMHPQAMWSVMPFNFYAGTGLATTRALATNTAIATGKLGNGEFSGMQANLRAFVTALAPMLYSGLYRSGTAAGQPGRPFLVAAAVMLGDVKHCAVLNVPMTLHASMFQCALIQVLNATPPPNSNPPQGQPSHAVSKQMPATLLRFSTC